MCGISGFNWRDECLINKFNVSLKHRGPDGCGAFLDDTVSLGHTRLSIIDLSKAASQPMSNENQSIYITYNGEIYNFKELRIRLEQEGHTFKSQSDTEVIVHSYEQYGPDCIKDFIGMWAFTIYDINKKILFLSRDRFGVKPLYYYWDGSRFIFSSEIKAILLSGIDILQNDDTIFEFLAFDLIDHSRDTFFKGINRLMPGECLIFDLTKRKIHRYRYYDINKNVKDLNDESEDRIIDNIHRMLYESVKSHLVSDVPVGSCLSGGIDSSSIVGIMRQIESHQQIDTVSLTFPGSEIDESRYIDKVAKDTNVTSFRTTPNLDDLLANLSDLILSQEEPFQSLSIYGQYEVMRLASSKGIKVLLDGQGGDELFCGYPKYYSIYFIENLLRFDFSVCWELLKSGKIDFIELCIFGLASIMDRWKITRYFFNRFRQSRMRYLQDYYDWNSSRNPLRKSRSLRGTLINDLKFNSIPGLLRYEDKNSMRWSVESRVPFLDQRLVEYALSIPSNLMLKGLKTKYCLRKAMNGTVPAEILAREDKIGFATPDADWLRSEKFISLFSSLFNSHQFANRKYWKSEDVKKLLTEHLEMKVDNSRILWRIANTELWLRLLIDANTRTPNPDFRYN